MKSLHGQIAVVAGATRGAGRGIACALGEAGATVYCTGRSVRGKKTSVKRKGFSAFVTERRPETIDETAEMVSARGGKGIAVKVDHTDEGQVKKLFSRIKREQARVDILVNDVWGGDALTEWGKPFWELDLKKGFAMIERAVFSHIIASRYAVPLMRSSKRGLIIEITDGDLMNYRGTFFYDFVKTSAIRLTFAMSEELRERDIATVAVTPGFLRSEAMLEYFGVTESNWQDGAMKDSNFIASESPLFVGRGVAALAADPNILKKTGKVFSSWRLSKEYGFSDADGRQPDWGAFFEETAGSHNRSIRDEMYRSHKTFLDSFRSIKQALANPIASDPSVEKARPLTDKQISVAEFLKSYPPGIRSTTNTLRKLISRLIPDLIERVYQGWRLIGYRVIDGKRTHYFCFLAPFKDRVVLGFEYGRLLDDPYGILEGRGTQVRQVTIRRRSQIQRSKLDPLILQAASIAIDRKKQ